MKDASPRAAFRLRVLHGFQAELVDREAGEPGEVEGLAWVKAAASLRQDVGNRAVSEQRDKYQATRFAHLLARSK